MSKPSRYLATGKDNKSALNHPPADSLSSGMLAASAAFKQRAAEIASTIVGQARESKTTVADLPEPLKAEILDVRMIEILAALPYPEVRETLKALIKELDFSTWSFSLEEIGIERALGKHSNIPSCCVETYIGDMLLLSAANRGLSPWEVSIEVTKGARATLRQKLKELPDEQRPSYVPCEGCAEMLIENQTLPSILHVCRDASEHPLCAFMMSLGKREPALPFPRGADVTAGSTPTREQYNKERAVWFERIREGEKRRMSR